MKLFKVTYQKICHPSQGLFFEDHQAYYLSNSLDELYNYVENIQRLTLKAIQILECEIVKTNPPSDINKAQFKSFNENNETTIIKAM